MWVTPKRQLEVTTIVAELSIFKHLTNNVFRPVFKLNYGIFKNGEAAHFSTKPLLFTGWHKAALEQNYKLKSIGY